MVARLLAEQLRPHAAQRKRQTDHDDDDERQRQHEGQPVPMARLLPAGSTDGPARGSSLLAHRPPPLRPADALDRRVIIRGPSLSSRTVGEARGIVAP